VKTIFEHHDLIIFDVGEIPTHGGSLRIFAKHKENDSQAILPTVAELLQKESDRGMNTLAYYEGFQQKVNDVKNQFVRFLLDAKKEGKKVVAYGAAAKGNTFLNYCGIKTDLIDFVVDANPNKQNKYLPGSHIPVVNEETLKEAKPDFVLIFPWNIKEEVIKQLEYIKNWNGKFVTAIPYLKII
jgi:ABC-type Fe3+-hydroxamate transport system substrate-binding protein